MKEEIDTTNETFFSNDEKLLGGGIIELNE